jgi:predicted dehydrogenase
MAEVARIGVIGCGWWATEAHLPALVANPRAEIAGIADPDADRRATAASAFGVERTFASAAELLDGVELDGAIVAVPHVHHHDVARAVLERRIHLLLEKPMVLRSEHGHELVRLAREGGVELLIGYPWHYNLQALAVRDAIAAGRIGPVEHVSCLFASIVRELYRGDPEPYREELGYAVTPPAPATYSDPVVSGGGQGQTQITHSAALLLFLTGLEVEEVSAVSERFELAVDLADAVALRFRGPAVGGLTSTGSVLAGHDEVLEYRIFGRDGHVLYDVNQGHGTIHTAGGVEELAPLPLDQRYPHWAPSGNLVEVALGDGTNGSPGELGAAVVDVVDAMYRSAREGRAVRVGGPTGS